MEEQQQEIPQIRTSPYMSPMHQYGSSIILMTNPEDELNKMELTFRSMRLDKSGNPIAIGDPLMNELGINSVIGAIQALVNRITVMSNMNKDEIPMLMSFLGDTLAKDLMMNKKAYAICTPSARDKIYFAALSTSYVTLKRAFEEGDKRFWKGSVQEIHQRVENPQKKGLLSGLNPWNK